MLGVSTRGLGRDLDREGDGLAVHLDDAGIDVERFERGQHGHGLARERPGRRRPARRRGPRSPRRCRPGRRHPSGRLSNACGATKRVSSSGSPASRSIAVTRPSSSARSVTAVVARTFSGTFSTDTRVGELVGRRAGTDRLVDHVDLDQLFAGQRPIFGSTHVAHEKHGSHEGEYEGADDAKHFLVHWCVLLRNMWTLVVGVVCHGWHWLRSSGSTAQIARERIPVSIDGFSAQHSPVMSPGRNSSSRYRLAGAAVGLVVEQLDLGEGDQVELGVRAGTVRDVVEDRNHELLVRNERVELLAQTVREGTGVALVAGERLGDAGLAERAGVDVRRSLVAELDPVLGVGVGVGTAVEVDDGPSCRERRRRRCRPRGCRPCRTGSG